MEVRWQEGELWLSLDLYEGPSELLLFFAERGKVPLSQLTLSELIQVALGLLEGLPLEDRLSILLFFAHLSRLKAYFLLPAPAVASETQPPPRSDTLAILPLDWLAQRIATYSYRLARMPSESTSTQAELEPISPWKLLQAYQAVLARQEKTQATYQVAPPPIQLETIEKDLLTRFSQNPQQSLRALWQNLPNVPLYRIAAFLTLLSWIAEGKLQYTATSLWDGLLEWIA